MRRILILYILQDGNYYSEGLVLFDGSVWTHHFKGQDEENIFKSLYHLKKHIETLDHIKIYNILEIDKKEDK